MVMLAWRISCLPLGAQFSADDALHVLMGAQAKVLPPAQGFAQIRLTGCNLILCALFSTRYSSHHGL